MLKPLLPTDGAAQGRSTAVRFDPRMTATSAFYQVGLSARRQPMGGAPGDPALYGDEMQQQQQQAGVGGANGIGGGGGMGNGYAAPGGWAAPGQAGEVGMGYAGNGLAHHSHHEAHHPRDRSS